MFIYLFFFFLPNALAIATFVNTAINGTIMIPEPKYEHISLKSYVTLPTREENGGGEKFGKPGSTVPAVRNNDLPP